MPEGLSPTEAGKEIAEHAKHAEHARDAAEHGGQSRHDRRISIIEAVLLSIVTITAAWSGYSAAKWGTESSLKLAKASATRTKANRDFLESVTLRSQDATNFNAWFTAYLIRNKNGMLVARRRFRPEYRVAFDAWLATHPFTNPNGPSGPQAMPQYKPTGAAQSVALDRQADTYYAEGEKAANTGDDYIRDTVILASVLFLVGISTQFPLRNVRYGLIGVGGVLLLIAFEQIFSLSPPP
jgi:hypothetical protein